MFDFKYKVKNDILTIIKSPSILNEKLLSKVFCRKNNIRTIILCEGIECIKEDSFCDFLNLEKVELPESLKKISERAFWYMSGLKEVIIKEGLLEIGEEAFAHCASLEEIKLPNSLKKIGEAAFYYCDSLKEMVIPDGITVIEDNLLCQCNNLEKIKLPPNLIKINKKSLEGCISLKEIEIPDKVSIINHDAFMGCTKLEKIVFPSSLKYIGDNVVTSCVKLKRIEILNPFMKLSECSFFGTRLEEIEIPMNFKYFQFLFLDSHSSLNKVVLKGKNGDITISLKKCRFIENSVDKIYWYDHTKGAYFFIEDDNCVSITRELFEKNNKVKNLINSCSITKEYYIQLYYWMNKKFVPNAEVIKNMPLNDIDNFFVNNNCKEWGKLINTCEIKYNENLGVFFKLCYVLGVFNRSVTVRDKAIRFIKEKIALKLNEDLIYLKFNDFNINNGYNEEYASFFMKYYDDDFMKMKLNDDKKCDFIAESYNNFYKVKEAYPNKVLNTNRNVDKLLPEHVISVVAESEYDNVDLGNELFASIVGRYGYSQEKFEVLQRLFNEAKKIEDKDIKLFISEDSKEEITYTLLDKDNPLGVVLGNITNCCQVIGGTADSCVRYGIIKPNSKFMAFSYKNIIIGQSWVWYDEISKTICLDNIELPYKYSGQIKNNDKMQEKFIECLLRMAVNFKKEMMRHQLEVKKVTIGKGHNELNEILDKYFSSVLSPKHLKDYYGYSDARRQYEIIRK